MHAPRLPLAESGLHWLRQPDRKHERHGERRARSECRDLTSVATIASPNADTGGRHDRRPPGTKPDAVSRSHHVACSEVDRHEPQERRDAEAEVDESLPLPRLRAGLINLEHGRREAARLTLGEGVQARPEDDVFARRLGQLAGDDLL